MESVLVLIQLKEGLRGWSLTKNSDQSSVFLSSPSAYMLLSCGTMVEFLLFPELTGTYQAASRQPPRDLPDSLDARFLQSSLGREVVSNLGQRNRESGESSESLLLFLPTTSKTPYGVIKFFPALFMCIKYQPVIPNIKTTPNVHHIGRYFKMKLASLAA